MADNNYIRSNGEFKSSDKVYGDLEPNRNRSYFKNFSKI